MAQKQRRAIGHVVSAEWDEVGKCINFVMELNRTGLRIRGRCDSGLDPRSGRFIDTRTLKASVDKVRNMILYDKTGKIDDANLTPTDLRRLRFNVSLSDADINVTRSVAAPDANSFLARILR